jgi:hypothetical protein
MHFANFTSNAIKIQRNFESRVEGIIFITILINPFAHHTTLKELGCYKHVICYAIISIYDMI